MNQNAYGNLPIFPPTFDEIDYLFEGFTVSNASGDRGSAFDILESTGMSIVLK